MFWLRKMRLESCHYPNSPVRRHCYVVQMCYIITICWSNIYYPKPFPKLCPQNSFAYFWLFSLNSLYAEVVLCIKFEYYIFIMTFCTANQGALLIFWSIITVEKQWELWDISVFWLSWINIIFSQRKHFKITILKSDQRKTFQTWCNTLI